MSNKPHGFLLVLKMDDKTIASRNFTVTEFNDNVIYSLKLNDLMKQMGALITDALKDRSVTEAQRLIKKDFFNGR